MAVWLAVFALLLLAACVARYLIGTGGPGWPGWPNEVIAGFRMRRMGFGVVVGASLAVAGVALQALLRNPLAEPFVLGLSTGAGVGVMLQGVLVYHFSMDLGTRLGGGGVGAVLGAGASMVIVYLAGQRRGLIDPLGLLLTGVVLSTINGAIIMLLNYTVGTGGLRDDLMRWMMGYLQMGVGNETAIAVAVLLAYGLVWLVSCGPAMDIATLSDAEARSMGVNLGMLRLLLFVTASVLTAGAVALSGPIAFVGLICPHIARLALGPSHGPLLIGAAMLGAGLIVGADTLSALIAWRWETFGLVPIGVFTAMIGGIAFLWMLHPTLGRGIE